MGFSGGSRGSRPTSQSSESALGTNSLTDSQGPKASWDRPQAQNDPQRHKSEGHPALPHGCWDLRPLRSMPQPQLEKGQRFPSAAPPYSSLHCSLLLLFPPHPLLRTPNCSQAREEGWGQGCPQGPSCARARVCPRREHSPGDDRRACVGPHLCRVHRRRTINASTACKGRAQALQGGAAAELSCGSASCLCRLLATTAQKA